MISKEEVKHIAKLARLELTETEVEKMQKDLSAIFDYFKLLKKAPLSQSSSEASQTKKANVLRGDKVLARDSGMAEKIIAGSPDKKDGYIKVKTIL